MKTNTLRHLVCYTIHIDIYIYTLGAPCNKERTKVSVGRKYLWPETGQRTNVFRQLRKSLGDDFREIPKKLLCVFKCIKGPAPQLQWGYFCSALLHPRAVMSGWSALQLNHLCMLGFFSKIFHISLFNPTHFHGKRMQLFLVKKIDYLLLSIT